MVLVENVAEIVKSHAGFKIIVKNNTKLLLLAATLTKYAKRVLLLSYFFFFLFFNKLNLVGAISPEPLGV